MDNIIHMNVLGCDVTIDTSYAVHTEEEKKRIIRNITRIYAEHESKKEKIQ